MLTHMGEVIYSSIKNVEFPPLGTKNVATEVKIDFDAVKKINRYLKGFRVLLAIFQIRFSQMYVGTAGTLDTDVNTIAIIGTEQFGDTKGIGTAGVLARKECIRVSHAATNTANLNTSMDANASDLFADDFNFTSVNVSATRNERFEVIGDPTRFDFNPPILLDQSRLWGYSKNTGEDSPSDQEQALIHWGLVKVSEQDYLLFKGEN